MSVAATPKARAHTLRLFARDIMSAPVVTARPDARVKDLVALMTAHHVSGIPVVTFEHELVGIVTEGDLLYKEIDPKPAEPSGIVQRIPLRSISDAVERARKAEALTAREIMTSPVIAVTEAATVREIASLMVKHRINRLPVLRAGRVVGIVSRADVLKAFNRDDAELTEAIRESLAHDLWIDPVKLTIDVKNGIVFLGGQMDRRSEKELIEKWVALADGVVGVESHLTFAADDRQYRPELPRR